MTLSMTGGPAGRAPAARSVHSHCPYCALQCAISIKVETHGVRVEPRDFPTNRGGLCQKGWTAAELLTSPERLTTPLVRVDGDLVPATWDDALDVVAAGIRRAQAAHGRDAVGVFGGGGLTNEKAYLLGKFARVALRTSAIDYNGRFCMSSAAAANSRVLGLDRGLPFPLADLAAADVVLLVGANIAETMPPLVRHLADMTGRGGRLVVVDPRETATAALATLHLPVTPGTDLALALGLLHVVVAEDLVDEAFVAERTNGFDAVRRRVAGWWPERVERVTGVSAEDVRRAARMLAAGARVVILTARGAEQHSNGTDTVTALLDLALALGLPGREGSGYGCLTGQGNGQGGREHGQKADQLPGYRRIDDPIARAHVAAVWGVDPATLPEPGRSAYELLDTLGTDGGVRALLVHGSNPVVSAPRAAHVTERLAALDLLVVADPFLSETAAMADVVLPVTQWAEEEGTTTNLEGRVLRRRQAVDPPEGVRSDLEVLAGLAARLRRTGHGRGTDFPADAFPTDAEAVFAELARASAGGPADYSGMTYDRLDATGGLYWPCPSPEHPGSPRLFAERFATGDGRACFVDVDHRPPAEDVDDEFPVLLTTGRVLAQYQSGTQTRRVRALREAAPEAFVEVAPDLADAVGVVEGQRVRVVSRRGECVVPMRISVAIRVDTVFMPFHWPGDGRANSLTNPALDPTSKMPEFKVCAVRLERAP
jgi:assimilatory nitrate reductase catalytic subunit